MSILLICTAAPLLKNGDVEKNSRNSFLVMHTAEKIDFDTFFTMQEEKEEAPLSAIEKSRFSLRGRPLLIAEGKPAKKTAAALFPEEQAVIEPLLNEIRILPWGEEKRSMTETGWKKAAEAKRKRGDPSQPESRDALIRRACSLLSLCADMQDPVLISGPDFLTLLLDCARSKGYVVGRSELGPIKPLEQIVLSRREEHCGGCGHNCFLSSPGCGVGKDKAARLKRT